MDIEYKGANALLINTKHASIAIDPKLSHVGQKDVSGKYTIELATQADFVVPKEDTMVIDSPGEYEVKGVSIKGIAAKRNIDTPEEGNKAIVYKIEVGDISVAVLGHIVSPLSEEQLELLGSVDVLAIPVGGNGYTIDAHGATQIVRQIDPKVVIPTHFADSGLKYEIPQQELEPFIKEMGVPHETTGKLKLKSGVLPAVTTIYELERS